MSCRAIYVLVSHAIYVLVSHTIYILVSCAIYVLVSSEIYALVSSAIYVLLSRAIYLLVSSAIYVLLSRAIYLLVSSAIYVLVSSAIYVLVSSAIYTGRYLSASHDTIVYNTQRYNCKRHHVYRLFSFVGMYTLNPRPTGGGGLFRAPPLVFLRYLLNRCRYHRQTCSTFSPNIFTHCVKILMSMVSQFGHK